MIVLVPPSEGKAEGGPDHFDPGSGAFGPSLAGQRCAVIGAVMTDVTRNDGPRRLFGTTGPLAERATQAFQLLTTSSAAALPAWRRYTGVVWTHLEPATLSPARRRQLVVPSALMGLAAGDDPVPDYRLKLSVSTRVTGRLDRWWRDAVTAALITHGRGAIVDLLPTEHAATIDWSELGKQRKVVRVSFVSGTGTGAAGHGAKAVKGILARRLLTDGLAAMPGFEWHGWTCERQGQRDLIVTAP
ncbi:MAG: peroxide stress protein YaaA [Acidobacteria bacterium]|nr:peroxide stress protein YaaA [Acidobacteriota bacterium]